MKILKYYAVYHFWMMDINFLINNTKKFKNCLIQKNFHSKKNSVSYVLYDHKPRVLKWFAPGFYKSMENEYNVLSKVHSKLNIPFVYEKDEKNNVIIMSYINGRNLCDVINDDTVDFLKKKKIMSDLAIWYKNFHNFFKKDEMIYIRGDSILRNFILTDQIWGLDFEEFRLGSIEEDISDLCISILTTDPKYTFEKYQLCRYFIESYSKKLLINFNKFSKELNFSLLNTMVKRGNPINKEYADKIIKKIFLDC
jgi:tRNA A-37 threonylcarbamoyl transferase component Bud32